MIRRNASRAFLTAAALFGFGLRAQADPEKVDARSCIPASAWAYIEGSTSQAQNWRDLVLGGLPDADRQAAEKAFDELWTELTKMASDEVGTDVGKFLLEIDRVHIALLDFHIVPVERDMGGSGKYTSDRPDVDLLVALKSKTPKYFEGLLDGDLKKYIEAGPDYKNHRTWVIDTGAGHDRDMKTVSSVHLVAIGDHVFASNLRATLEKVIDAAGGAAIPGGPITANPDFMRAQKQAGTDPIVLGFVNLRTLLTGVEASLDRDDLAEYQMSDAVAGQSTLRSAVLWGTMDGRYSLSGGSIYLDATNEMWSILQQAPAPKNLLGVIPGKCIGCGIMTIHEPEKMWGKIRAFVNEKTKLFIEPGDTDRQQGFERGLGEMEEALGTSVSEILGAVDDEIGWAAMAPDEGRMDERAIVVFIEIKDEDKAKAVIAALKEGQIIGQGGGELTSSEFEGVTCWNNEGARTPFGYAIINKVFVLTFDPATQKKIILAWKNGETLGNDKAYKTAMKKLPAENSKLFYYNYLAFARMAAEMSREIDPKMLEKMKGDQGVALVTIERPDELSFLCGSELSSELSASMIQALLPMFQKERQGAERTKKLSVLRNVGTAASTWVSMESDGSHFPTTLQTLVDSNMIDASALKKADGTDGKLVYCYPVLASETAPEFILAYDSERLLDGFAAVLYFSGAVETIEGEKLDELLKTQDEQTLKDLPAAIDTAKKELDGAAEEQKKAIDARLKFLQDLEAKLKAAKK